ncbi:MAG: glycosyltransferase family protein [Caldilineaceae bacterium]
MNAIAYFISPHGFGHSTRAAAVMTALQRRQPDLHCHIFTRAPRWLFEESLIGPFSYHELNTDVGLAQHDALNVDVAATVDRLAEILPFPPKLIDDLARTIHDAGCERVFCDIAPMGVAVAQAAGLPAVMVENFTWDWIYQGYVDLDPRLQPYSDLMAAYFAAADIHIQASPVCLPRTAAKTVAPISRTPRSAHTQIRAQIGVPADAQLVLVTMGGMDWRHDGLAALADLAPVHFLFTGGAVDGRQPENVHFLPPRSGIFHPDLVNAADAVVGKIGYSTLAEVYYAGIPYGYIPRRRFWESAVLGDFVQAQMTGLPIPEDSFVDGSWAQQIPALVALPRRKPTHVNGAEEVADLVLSPASPIT